MNLKWGNNIQSKDTQQNKYKINKIAATYSANKLYDTSLVQNFWTVTKWFPWLRYTWGIHGIGFITSRRTKRWTTCSGEHSCLTLTALLIGWNVHSVMTASNIPMMQSTMRLSQLSRRCNPTSFFSTSVSRHLACSAMVLNYN